LPPKPAPEAFGLAESELRDVEEMYRRYIRREEIGTLLGSVGFVIMLLVPAVWRWASALVWPALGFAALLLGSSFLSWIWHDFLPSHPKLVALGKHGTAVQDYERESSERAAREQRKLVDFWCGLSGTGLEAAVAALLRKLGHKIRETGGPAAPATVRDLLGTRTHTGAKQAILISTSGPPPSPKRPCRRAMRA